MNDRFNFQSQIEHLHLKYVGTGTQETTKWEWGTNIQRDSLASHIGHHSRLQYFLVAENETSIRMKNRFIDKMIQPCGPPPPERKKGDLN
ncbi:hypothetical protein ABPG72_013324 [Tetrahymena utriculariae]